MSKKDLIFGLLTAMVLAVIFSPLASSLPDGLEKVAADQGFLTKGEEAPLWTAPVADYVWPGVKSAPLATALAGLAGTLLVFGCAAGAGMWFNRNLSRLDLEKS